MSRDRDRKLEHALKHELRGAGTPDRDACIDAETLAAWADGGLDANTVAMVEAHVSSCARCQAIAGATARSGPVVPGVSERAFRFPSWLIAPIAATAAVVVWMVIPQRPVPPPPAASVAPATPQAAPAPDALADANTPRSEAAAPARENREERSAPAPQRKQETAVADQLAETVTVGAAAGAQPPRPPAAASSAAAPMLQRSAPLGVAAFEIATPNPAIRWRVVAGTIERSEDAGASWVPIRPPAGEVITGGTAPTASICWFIGPNGLVMVTADGQAFARVPLPERVDLTGITAVDARSATVTTADGRRFTTNDSGRTWRQN